MAKEHFIVGKRDSGRHDGAYANAKRLQEAEFELDDFLKQNSPVEFLGPTEESSTIVPQDPQKEKART